MFILLPPDSAIVSQWLTFLTPVALAILAVIQTINSRAASATKVTVVETAKAVKAIDTTTKDIHKLTNSAMGAQMMKSVEDAEQVVVILKVVAALRKEPADLAAVTAAELIVAQRKTLLQQHLVDQAMVDATARQIEKDSIPSILTR